MKLPKDNSKVVALFRIPLFIDLISNTYIYISIDGSNFSKHFTVLDLYYLYCLSIFQRTLRFFKSLRFKSGCKGKGLFYNYQMFWEVFLVFFSEDYLTALLRKEKNLQRKKRLLFANRTAKIRTFKH